MYKVNYMWKKIILTKSYFHKIMAKRELLYRSKVHYKNVTLIFVFETIKRTNAQN